MTPNFDLTYNNHFCYGYDGNNNFQLRENGSQAWSTGYGRCLRKVNSFADESIEAARLIKSNTDEIIWLCFSGGIDSEFMVRSFMEAKVSFNIAIMKFKNDINIEDVKYAFDFCNHHELKYYTFELDIVKWLENDLMSYAIPNQCVSPQYPPLWWLVEQFDGYPVFSLGDQVWRREENKETFFLNEKEMVQSHYRYLINNNRPGTPGFLHYTPEQMLSFILAEQHMIMFLYGKSMGIVSNQRDCIKIPTYTKTYKMKKRPKYNGFEKIMKLDNYWRNILNEKLPYNNATFLSSPQRMAKLLWPKEMKKEQMYKEVWHENNNYR